jgi:hypothetical protein
MIRTMKSISIAALLGTFGTLQSASAAVMITGKEVGIQFISGTMASAPTESKIHKQGTTVKTLGIDEKAAIMIGPSEIVIDFGAVPNSIVFSSENFSGLRFYDFSEIDLGDNDPAFSLPSLVGSGVNQTAGNTDVQEANGAMFSQSRVTVDENNIYVNFSGLTIRQATGTKVVISIGEIVPEPSSTMLIGLAGVGLGLRRKR